MNLGVIDKDEYRQYRYWQLFQKLLLPAAAGLTVAALLFKGIDLQRLAGVVAGIMWLLFVAAAVMAHQVGQHMVRNLPSSMQSLLLFSNEDGDDAPRASNGEMLAPPAQADT